MKKLFMAIMIWAPIQALADQCEVLTPAQAQTAIQLLMSAKRIQLLCQPCGESMATDLTYQTLALTRFSQTDNLWTIKLDKENIDLAYTYVDGKNLALQSACPAVDVTPEVPDVTRSSAK